MAYCSNCGAVISAGMRFCPNCGAEVSGARGGEKLYRVIFLSRGSATVQETMELLEDIFNYSPSEINAIMDNAPTEIACQLDEQQAWYIARALSEYGIEVSVCCGDSFVDVPTDTKNMSGSVYTPEGGFVAGAAAAFAALTAANRIRRFARWMGPDPRDHRFAAPPRRLPPRRMRRPVPPPPPQPPRPARPARPAKPAPRPAPPRSPAQGGMKRGGPSGSRGGGPRGGGPGGAGPGGTRNGGRSGGGFGGRR